MNRLSAFIFTFIFVLTVQNGLFAQKLIQNEGFFNIPVSQGKAILMKEIPLAYPGETQANYNRLKTWVKDNYTTDLLNSGIKYDNQADAVYVKSRVDLLLPLLNSGELEAKAVMRYKMDMFIEKGKCVVLISDISYKMQNTTPKLTQPVKAEDFVVEDVVYISNQYTKQKIETRKGTLYFFNNLVKDLETALNPPA